MYGLLRVFGGLFLIWDQFEHRKPGTLGGLDWPHNLHAVLSDVKALFLLLGAVSLICVGIFGQEKVRKTCH